MEVKWREIPPFAYLYEANNEAKKVAVNKSLHRGFLPTCLYFVTTDSPPFISSLRQTWHRSSPRVQTVCHCGTNQVQRSHPQVIAGLIAVSECHYESEGDLMTTSQTTHPAGCHQQGRLSQLWSGLTTTLCEFMAAWGCARKWGLTLIKLRFWGWEAC